MGGADGCAACLDASLLPLWPADLEPCTAYVLCVDSVEVRWGSQGHTLGGQAQASEACHVQPGQADRVGGRLAEDRLADHRLAEDRLADRRPGQQSPERKKPRLAAPVPVRAHALLMQPMACTRAVCVLACEASVSWADLPGAQARTGATLVLLVIARVACRARPSQQVQHVCLESRAIGRQGGQRARQRPCAGLDRLSTCVHLRRTRVEAETALGPRVTRTRVTKTHSNSSPVPRRPQSQSHA
jgi:hypothetical protein